MKLFEGFLDISAREEYNKPWNYIGSEDVV